MTDAPTDDIDQQAPDDPTFDEAATLLGLGSLLDRKPRETKRVRDLVGDVRRRAFGSGGKMLLGVHMSFVALAEQSLDVVGDDSAEDVLTDARFQTTSAGATKGQTVDTLTLVVSDAEGTQHRLGIRRFYNDFMNYGRGPALSRPSYPSSPGHSTSRWRHNEANLKTIFAMSPKERRAVAERLWELTLSLPRWRRRLPPRTVRDPFVQVLRDFDRRARSGETSGAPLQGLVYGFMAADAPNSHLRTASARTGAKHAGLVGDIDGYDGPDLTLTAEVKDRALSDPNEITDFYSNRGPWPDAVAFVACREATETFRSGAGAQDIRVLTVPQLVDQVSLWTVPKQLSAIRSAMGYFEFYERKPDLADRFQAFLDDRGISLRG